MALDILAYMYEAVLVVTYMNSNRTKGPVHPGLDDKGAKAVIK